MSDSVTTTELGKIPLTDLIYLKEAIDALLAGKASAQDAKLTAMFGDWACEPSTYQGSTITVFDNAEGHSWDLYAGGNIIGSINKSSDEDTDLVFRAGADWYGDVNLIATRTKSYRLGSQSDKPLAPAGDYAKRSEIPTVPANVSAFTNDAGYLTAHQELRYELATPKQTTSGTAVTATLVDRAINAVELASTVTEATFYFPAAVAGRARDFFLRLTITGAVPTLYFREPGGATVSFDADDDAWSEIEQGVNLIMFTETSQA